MKHRLYLHQFFLTLLVISTTIKAEVIKQCITTPQGSTIWGIIASVNNQSYITIQKCADTHEDSYSIYSLIMSFKPDLIIWEVMPNNDLLVGYFKNDNEAVSLIFNRNNDFIIQSLAEIQSRSCFEYANPITRTFDQLNVRRCMRIGGDLIVCGKIINDPVCAITPCATQIER